MLASGEMPRFPVRRAAARRHTTATSRRSASGGMATACFSDICALQAAEVKCPTCGASRSTPRLSGRTRDSPRTSRGMRGCRWRTCRAQRPRNCCAATKSQWLTSSRIGSTRPSTPDRLRIWRNWPWTKPRSNAALTVRRSSSTRSDDAWSMSRTGVRRRPSRNSAGNSRPGAGMPRTSRP